MTTPIPPRSEPIFVNEDEALQHPWPGEVFRARGGETAAPTATQVMLVTTAEAAVILLRQAIGEDIVRIGAKPFIQLNAAWMEIEDRLSRFACFTNARAIDVADHRGNHLMTWARP